LAGRTALSEEQPALVIVVPTATQLDLIDGGLPTQRVRVDVMELDEPTVVAAVTFGADERATCLTRQTRPVSGHGTNG
jgi:hypothetical protein